MAYNHFELVFCPFSRSYTIFTSLGHSFLTPLLLASESRALFLSMSSFNRSYGQSPPSPVSNGAFESIQGTPNTAITAISPEDARVPKQSTADSRASSVTTTVNQHDPFVTTGTTTGRASAQLSATASAFQPLHLYGPAVGAPITGNLIANGSGPTTLIPGTIQYLDNVVASQSPVRESEVTSYGVSSDFSLFPP